MKITNSKRVIYKHNPVHEVVFQVRFDPEIEVEAFLSDLQQDFVERGYSKISEGKAVGIKVELGEGGYNNPTLAPPLSVYVSATEDDALSISVCAEFLAVSSSNYTSWESFSPLALEATEILCRHAGPQDISRIGLRYMSLIERESLGLEGVPWHELIKPFLLGPLVPGAFSDTDEIPSESETFHFSTQAMLQLDTCKLMLQSSVLNATEGPQKAFMIDADYFNDGPAITTLLSQPSELHTHLENLHSNAGALFRRVITEKLHVALSPVTA
ncbi:TIGR04255 family protein [Pseudomonas viridiflava]|uniref:TIGR04255 family protein n=1 Tax=Pseudomonas viridiflava TaxID=33069 RepID=UPI002E9B005B|nr:TIGR04255 family protein [Pseudomonas viridiflava]WKW32853.1 TIGR04255 family protein [Pseudomonas viridiflava]